MNSFIEFLKHSQAEMAKLPHHDDLRALELILRKWIEVLTPSAEAEAAEEIAAAKAAESNA